MLDFSKMGYVLLLMVLYQRLVWSDYDIYQIPMIAITELFFIIKITNKISLMVQNEYYFISKYGKISPSSFRLILESFLIYFDGIYEFNYGLQIILFERFIDIFLFCMKFLPLFINIIKQNSSNKTNSETPLKPLFDE